MMLGPSSAPSSPPETPAPINPSPAASAAAARRTVSWNRELPPSMIVSPGSSIDESESTASSTAGPALTIRRIARGRLRMRTSSCSDPAGRKSPSPECAAMKSSVRLRVRLYTATRTPWDARLRARFSPIVARPTTPISCSGTMSPQGLLGAGLGRIVLRLHDPHLDEAGGLEVSLEAVERGERDVLGGRDDAAQKLDVAVQVLVVDGVDELPPKHRVDMPEVHDHPRLRIDRSPDRDLDHVVVAVVVDARAENLAVLSVTPFRAAEDVARGKRRTAGDADVGHSHYNVCTGGSILMLAPESGADSGEANHNATRATSGGCSIGVSTAPGLIALTRMPSARPSEASASVSPARPDFAATYAAMPGNFSAPATPDRLEIMKIEPP